MKRFLLEFLLIVCGIAAIGLSTSIFAGGVSGGTDLSPCLSDATIQVSATPAVISLGQSSSVRWAVVLPTGCNAVQVQLNNRIIGRSGNQVVTPARTTAYTVVLSETRAGVTAQTSASTHVTVRYPAHVVIDPSTADPVGLLLGALGDSANPQQTIELCNVDLDLTGYYEIAIGDNHSLIASPACARGPRSEGPRIFVTDTRGSKPLFQIRGDNILVSGFRLEGPSSEITQGDIKEKGLQVYPFASAAPIRHIEISNMEVFHWAGAGVDVRDNQELAVRGRLFNTNEGAVQIKNNFFHHNRHGSGEGYGVSVSDGGYALIEENVFDENRHAIAGISTSGNGQDYAGYTARDNLILPGGGLHCSENPVYIFCGWQCNCTHTHQIDMHGDDNQFYSGSNWECGTAGETILIERNTVLYTAGLAIKIRGNPADKAVVDGDVFKIGNRGDAIGQNGFCGYGDNITNPIDVLPNNVFDADPMAELGSCDFFGDGQADQFMATGATWWALSPVTGQWRYLNTMHERLSELQLGKFDGDAICDVALRPHNPDTPPQTYSMSGTSAWAPLMVAHH